MRMDATEDELVAAIAKVLSGPGPRVHTSIGDDAAVVEPGTGELVLAADALVEAVHFDRAISSARWIGYRAVVVNTSDIAAMAASPRFGLVSLGLPSDVDAAWVIELYGGMREAADEYGLSLVGGDLSRAEELVISIALTGEVAPGCAVLRSGARPGDRVVVTGSLGGAAGGLALARTHRAARYVGSAWASRLERAFERPVARVGEAGLLARAGATAMMDISDGLAKDLFRLCAASGVGARVELDDVPIATALLEGEDALGVDPMNLALHGGDDYELLATIRPAAVDGVANELRREFGVALAGIGTIFDGAGVVAVKGDGSEAPMPPRGWDHFGG
jgi:thiamine-monophosphate kinase